MEITIAVKTDSSIADSNTISITTEGDLSLRSVNTHTRQCRSYLHHKRLTYYSMYSTTS